MCLNETSRTVAAQSGAQRQEQLLKTYLVSYDLDKPGQNYHPLIGRLEQLGAAKVLYSEWLLKTASSASAIRDDLKRFVDGNDMVLVVALTGEAAWTSVMITNQEVKQLLAA